MNPNSNITSKSQVHCANYWKELAHINTLYNQSNLLN